MKSLKKVKTYQEENFIKQSMPYSEKAVYMHEARTACFKKECSGNRDKTTFGN